MANRLPVLRDTLKKNRQTLSALHPSTPSSKSVVCSGQPSRCELDAAANFQTITIEEKHVD
jgi:hypothetical protein